MSRSGSVPRRGLPAVPGVSAPPDRRFRRADLPIERRRLTGRLRRLARWTVPAVLCAALALWGASAILQSGLLKVREIVVVGNTRLSSGAVESLVSGLTNEDILRADLEVYRQRLLDSPWVADVRLSRVLPATIRIAVVERTPIAVARLDQQLYLVGEDGSIIDDYGPEYREFDLPVVDGLVSTTAATGDRPAATADRAHLTAELLRALGSRPDLRDRLSQIDVSNAHDAVVMFDDDVTWLHLGDERFLERLERYVELRPSLGERFGPLDYVDLRFDNRIYLRGRNTGGARRGISR